MINVMVDIETLGTEPGCVVLSIGAVAFDKEMGFVEDFYEVINTVDSFSEGLTYDNDTLAWWKKQPEC
jgi:hypothetical protein